MATVRSWELTNTLKDWRSWENTSLGGDLYSWEVIFETRGDTGVFIGGAGGSIHQGSCVPTNIIDTVVIGSNSTASDFGDLTNVTYCCRCTSNGVGDRAVVHIGETTSYVYTNTINYLTISTSADASNFGETSIKRQGGGACSNRVNGRAVFACGVSSAGGYPADYTFDYVTISTTGNATYFGVLDPIYTIWPFAYNDGTSNCENNRGIFVGGKTMSVDPGWPDDMVIRYITITSLGNALNYGDLAAGVLYSSHAACSNGTKNRGCFTSIHGTSASWNNSIEYITISTIGNASDFGDLLFVQVVGGCISNCSGQKAAYGGGINHVDSLVRNDIETWSISTIGNATDFGDLSTLRMNTRGTSNA
jgi:hypothetical protein